VTGVAEHDGELLPVFDLGMYFGRRSPVTPKLWMILVKNGDFQALILAEAVMRERLLPVNIQQGLPSLRNHTKWCTDVIRMRLPSGWC
jgi:chemotaxis signal transduction protein